MEETLAKLFKHYQTIRDLMTAIWRQVVYNHYHMDAINENEKNFPFPPKKTDLRNRLEFLLIDFSNNLGRK